jgi:hypothetical protein
MTDQTLLDSEKDAANAFLKHKGLPLIESIKFIDEDDTDSYIMVNNGLYYIQPFLEQREVKSLRGTRIQHDYGLKAFYTDEPYDPQEPGGEITIHEDIYFGSLSYFLVRIALENVFREWRNFYR